MDIFFVHQADTLYLLFLINTKRIIAAAGVTPSILKACPRVFGLIVLSLNLISFDNALNES